MNRNRSNILKIIAIALMVKATYVLLSVSVDYLNNNHSFEGTHVFSFFSRNDSGWYGKIATQGYSRITDVRDLGYSKGKEFKQSEWAFFPFYPLVVRGLMNLLSCSFLTSGFILSILFSLTAFVGLYLFLVDYGTNIQTAFFTTLLFIVFPFHYFFSMYLTEALFFTCIIFCFICVMHKKYFWMSLLLIPTTLLRPNGIVFTLPLYLFMLEKEQLLRHPFINFWFILKRSLYFVSALLAFIGYGMYQQAMTGHFFAFAIAQAGWYKQFMFPLLGLFRRSDFASQFGSYYAIAFMIVAILVRKKIPFSLNVFLWIYLLLPLCAGSTMSMARYLSIVFPFSMIFSQWILQRKKSVSVALLAIMFFLHMITYYTWHKGLPISF